MDQHLNDIIAAALKLVDPVVTTSDDPTVTVTIADTERFSEASVEARRKGTGFLKRGAPAPGTPVHQLSITGVIAAGIAHSDPYGFLIDIADPTTDPQLELLSTWTLSGNDMMPVNGTLEFVAPYVLELLANPPA